MELHASEKCSIGKLFSILNNESDYDNKDEDVPEEVTPAKKTQRNSQRYYMTLKNTKDRSHNTQKIFAPYHKLYDKKQASTI